MAWIVDHLPVEELEARYRAARDATEARHTQAIWLLARGRTFLEVAAVLAFAPRWVEELAARYNAAGPEALGDQRRRNGRAASLGKTCWPLWPSGWRPRPKTAGYGAAPRWRSGWRGTSASSGCSHSGAGRRCSASAGQSTRHRRR